MKEVLDLLCAVVTDRLTVDELAGRMAVFRAAHPDEARQIEFGFLRSTLHIIAERGGPHAALARNALKITEGGAL